MFDLCVFQGLLEWRFEVQLLVQIFSLNVCVVKGYCVYEVGLRLSMGERWQEWLLVFEQLYNGFFFDYFFGNCYLIYLDWRMRIDIVFGVVCGLLYIYDCVLLQIVYKDFCVLNVLLDWDFVLRLVGYGLLVIVMLFLLFKLVSKWVFFFLGLGFY